MTAAEELTIISTVLGGQPDAFEALVVDNQQKVYNLALKMTKNEEDAMDVSQEAFLKAYRSLDKFRGDSRFSVWLYRMTYNLCIDLLRRRTRTGSVSLTHGEDADDVGEIEIPDLRNLPEDAAIRHETRQAIKQSIEELPPKHREILIMREVSGMSYSELADALAINEGTVKSRLARARLALVNILEKKGTFPDSIRLRDVKEVGDHG